MKDQRLYGMGRMADYLGMSVETLRQRRKRPEGQFIKVGSMDNVGGGLGRAAWSWESSLDNLKVLMKARTAEARRQAAFKRWRLL